MKILVTGAAGFIGSYVAKALLADGCEVIGVDNFNSYYDVRLKEMRHSALENMAGYTGIRGDINDFELLSDVFKKYQPDRVCHLAASLGLGSLLKIRWYVVSQISQDF